MKRIGSERIGTNPSKDLSPLSVVPEHSLEPWSGWPPAYSAQNHLFTLSA
jgi:hypothetical protein